MNGENDLREENMPLAEEDCETCACTEVHEELLSRVREQLPSADTTAALAELFKVLGDGTRMRILLSLFYEEVCVCDLSRMLDMSISAVSHQLRILRQARLVRARRVGKSIFYSLADGHVRTCIGVGLSHVTE